ncbi:MAG: pitrilysin family protein [Ignavibacteriales bacterium]|nr:pitrilysin family protein [Ignavibacteriales bacterium]
MIDRSTAPAPEKSLLFNLPEVKELKLSNGASLYFVRKEKLPIVYTNVLVLAGSKFDPSDKRGLGYLTSLLIDEGAGEYDSLQLSDEFEKLGSIFSVNSNHDLISMTLLSLKENFIRSLELLSKVILSPKFEEKDFAREKKKVLDRILQLKDEPSFIASTAFDKVLFGKTYYAYPEIGYVNSVNEISNGDVKKLYQDIFTASNTKFIVVGNLTEEEAVEQFNKYLGGWEGSIKSSVSFEMPKRNPTQFYFVHKENSAQSEIRVGHISKKRNAEDYIPARIMNTILGGQFSSRINHNLREEKGFTYGANSGFQYFQDAGAFEVSTAVNIENTGASISEIIKELEGIRKNISHEEIEFAKSYLIKQFPSRFETYSQVAKNIEQLLIHNLSFNELADYTAKIESAADGSVIKSAVENVFPDELVVVAVGDREKIPDQVKNLIGEDAVELDNDGNVKE